MRRNRRSAAPTTEAMVIPAMAPPESLFPLSVCSSFPPLGTFVAGVVDESVVPMGAGEGGGASPGQGPRGPPQRADIRRNAARGLERSEAGMDLLRRLKETLNSRSCGSGRSGISPTKRFSSRSRVLRRVRLARAGGMAPERPFPPSER
ncbi:hypothetical protein D1007_58600 [Hordeum vulgare]|nr:hypothetical protein D1007_58600 [Hordeum vulgare]